MSSEKTSAASNEMVTRKEVAIGVQASIGGASEKTSTCTIANKAGNVVNDNGDKDGVCQTSTNPAGMHEDATVLDVEKTLIEVGAEKAVPSKATKVGTTSTDGDALVLPSEENLPDSSDKPAKELQPISDPESRNRLKQSLSKHFTKKHPLSYLNSLDPKHDKYKAIIAQADSSEECTIYPDLEGEEKVALKKKELESLLRERPRPTEVYLKAAAIQAAIDSLVHHVKPKRAKVNSAMEILSESLGSLELCEKKVDFLGCVEWEKIYNASRKVLNDYLDHLLDKGLHAVAANKIRVQQQQRKLPLNNQGGKVASTSGSSGDATVENIITSEGENILTHPMVATEMEVDELISKVSFSADKKKSAKRRKKNKTGELISEADLAKALRAKWSFKRQSDGKTFGADNRLGHGLTRSEGRLHCSLCDTPISCRGSISQHLSTAGHQARLSDIGGKVMVLPGNIVTDRRPKKVAYVFEERFLWHTPWCLQYSPLVQPFEVSTCKVKADFYSE
uniref:Uncharacterized protein n=1 Tax=Chaetoceros debilis TaxID=122233 RepID=A0A7S3V5D0_9STRA